LLLIFKIHRFVLNYLFLDKCHFMCLCLIVHVIHVWVTDACKNDGCCESALYSRQNLVKQHV